MRIEDFFDKVCLLAILPFPFEDKILRRIKK